MYTICQYLLYNTSYNEYKNAKKYSLHPDNLVFNVVIFNLSFLKKIYMII